MHLGTRIFLGQMVPATVGGLATLEAAHNSLKALEVGLGVYIAIAASDAFKTTLDYLDTVVRYNTAEAHRAQITLPALITKYIPH